MCTLCLGQFVIVVIDSTDRERLPITKEELCKMLATDVSVLVFMASVDLEQYISRNIVGRNTPVRQMSVGIYNCLLCLQFPAIPLTLLPS